MQREKKREKRIHHLGRQKTKSADSRLQSISVDWASDIPSFSSGRPHASDRIFFPAPVIRMASEALPDSRVGDYGFSMVRPEEGEKASPEKFPPPKPPCQPRPDLTASIVSNAKNGALLCADTV